MIDLVYRRIEKPPRSKWFSATYPDAENWDGPYNTIEEAMSCQCANEFYGAEDAPMTIWITHGHKMNRFERAEMGFDEDVTWVMDEDAVNFKAVVAQTSVLPPQPNTASDQPKPASPPPVVGPRQD